MSIFLPPKMPLPIDFTMGLFQPQVIYTPTYSHLVDISLTDIEIIEKILYEVKTSSIKQKLLINHDADYAQLEHNDAIDNLLAQYRQMPTIQFSEKYSPPIHAAYNSFLDRIFMHYWYQYENALHFYICLIHELVHSTEIKSRLNRKIGFGDPNFDIFHSPSEDILVEEIVAVFATAIILYNCWRENEDAIISLSGHIMAVSIINSPIDIMVSTDMLAKAQIQALEAVNYIRKGGE